MPTSRNKQQYTPEERARRAADCNQKRYYGRYDRKEDHRSVGNRHGWIVPTGFLNLQDFLNWRKSMGLPTR